MLHLRESRKGDFDALWRIDQDCFVSGIAYSRFELGAYMRAPGSFTIVAEWEGKVAGFIVCHWRRQIGHVITIDVKAEARRHHVGSALLEAAEKRLVEKKCMGVFLETAVDNAAAIAFYKKHGYSVMRTIPRYYLGAIDALTMGKPLS